MPTPSAGISFAIATAWSNAGPAATRDALVTMPRRKPSATPRLTASLRPKSSAFTINKRARFAGREFCWVFIMGSSYEASDVLRTATILASAQRLIGHFWFGQTHIDCAGHQIEWSLFGLLVKLSDVFAKNSDTDQHGSADDRYNYNQLCPASNRVPVETCARIARMASSAPNRVTRAP